MSTYVNRWSAVFGWTTLMLIVWALFVPRGLSVGTFTLLTGTGALLLVSGSTWWAGHRRSPSIPAMRPSGAGLQSNGRTGTDASSSR